MGLLDVYDKLIARTPPPLPPIKKGREFSDEEREEAQKVRSFKQKIAEQKAEMELKAQEIRLEKDMIKQELEIEKAKIELEQLRETDEPDVSDVVDGDGINMDKMLMMMLMNVMQKNQTPAANTNISTPQTSDKSHIDTAQNAAGVSLTDEQIDGYIKKIPKIAMRKIKKLDDDALKVQILNINPNLDANTIKRIIVKLRA